MVSFLTSGSEATSSYRRKPVSIAEMDPDLRRDDDTGTTGVLTPWWRDWRWLLIGLEQGAGSASVKLWESMSTATAIGRWRAAVTPRVHASSRSTCSRLLRRQPRIAEEQRRQFCQPGRARRDSLRRRGPVRHPWSRPGLGLTAHNDGYTSAITSCASTGGCRPVSNGHTCVRPRQRGSSRNARATGMPVSA